MKQWLALIPFLFMASLCSAQTPIQVGPYSSSNVVYVCSFPETGFPCTNQATVYTSSSLGTPLVQPIALPANSTVIYYVTNGSTYREQIVGTVNAQFLVYGGASGGAGTVTTSGSPASADCTYFSAAAIITGTANCTLDSSGNLIAAGIVTGASFKSGAGASACGNTATGGMCNTEAASTGFTPTAGQDYVRADSTLHRYVEAANGGSEFPLGQIIGHGTAALGTSSISSTACATVVTVSATGVASTDSIEFTPNASIKAVTGYTPATTGGLTIVAYPTANNVNFDVCNWSTGTITPGAVTLNFVVVR